MPSENSIRRLPFIRYLYDLGLQQSRQPKPLSAAAILTFHDSVELFLQLATEELDIEAKKGTGFMDYWKILKGNLPNGASLGFESQMNRLNMLRVGLKHHGIIPDESETERCRVNLTNFFEESVPMIFNQPFDKVSMTDLVLYAPAREDLNEATILIEDGKFNDAMIKIAIAFDQIIEDYEGRKESKYGKSLFHFGLSSPFSIRYDDVDRDMRRFISESIEPIQNAMKIISLGIDYKRYAKFRFLCPKVHKIRAKEGGYHYFPSMSSRSYKKEDCQFCNNFVIESAVRIQDFDFDIE